MCKEWTVKKIKISLADEDELDDWIHFQIFDDSHMDIYKNPHREQDSIHIEEISISAAKIIRDFLIYALKDLDE